MPLDLEAFNKHIGHGPADDAPDSDVDDSSHAADDSAGMSPGDQAIKAIQAGDGAAFEEAIRRITSEQ